MHGARHAKQLLLVGSLALLCACAAEETAEPDAAEDAAGSVAREPAGDATGAETGGDPLVPEDEGEGEEYFLLEEFDWGDDPEVVEESLLFDPAYECRGTVHDRCRLVKVYLEEEELLARFRQHDGGLWQIVFLTPDLDPNQAADHLGRVWQVLVDYVTRWVGEPEEALELPALESLEVGPPQPTHRWKQEGLGAFVGVGRRDEDLFYVGAWFFDPAVEAEARPGWEAALRREDEVLRKRRAAKAARAAARAESAEDANGSDEEEEAP